MTAASASKLRLVFSLGAICPPSTCTISSWAGGAQSFWAGGLRFSSASTSPTLVNIRLTHPAFQNTTVFFGAIWYNIPHEIAPATLDLYFRLCAGQCDEHYPLLPANGGADEAGLYRTQVGSELLASPTCSACGA